LSYSLVEIQTYCSLEAKRSFSIQQIKIFSLSQTIFIGISLFFLPIQVVQFKNNHFRLVFHEHFSYFSVQHLTFEDNSHVCWITEQIHLVIFGHSALFFDFSKSNVKGWDGNKNIQF
jgi:hypothetical protein